MVVMREGLMRMIKRREEEVKVDRDRLAPFLG
jgi:hypothetical protein